MRNHRYLAAAIAAGTAAAAIAAQAPAVAWVAQPVAASTVTGHHGPATWKGEGRTGGVRLHGEVPMSVRSSDRRNPLAKRTGARKASAPMTLNFGLPLRNVAELNADIANQAKTHHPLTRAQVYARFAPTAAQADALRTWLTDNGYRITHVAADRTSIGATAPTSTVESTLSTTVNNYRRKAFTYQGVHVAPYSFYANTTDPKVPARLGLQSVSGLSDVARFFTDAQLAAAHKGSGPNGVLTRSGGGYYPQDLRSMYDVSGHSIDGTGQTIGFTLWGAGETQAAMSQFATTTGDTPITVDSPCVATGNSPTTPSSCINDQPAPNHLESILENGNDNGASGSYEYAGNVETALDIEQAHGMAPGVAMKYYLADCASAPPSGSGLTNATCNGSDTGLEDAVEDAASDPTLHSVSNSWGYGGDVEFGANDPFRLVVQNSFALAAAAGTTFWFSTGDGGTVESGFPADSQYVVAVGGTSDFSTTNLAGGSTGSTATRSTATTWTGAGSWCSNLEPRPAWQSGAAVTAKAPCPGRVVPDISADADTNTSVYVVATASDSGGTPALEAGGVGGTSVAGPLLNGMEADTESFLAQQSYAGGTTPAIGFEGPELYALGDSSDPARYFNDVVCGNTASPVGGPDGDAASAGWDPATGWGEIDWFNYSTGYAIDLGATGLSQPASLNPHYAFGCAQTPTNAAERGVSMPTDSTGYAVGSPTTKPWPATYLANNSWGATNTFLKTTDGGATWQPTNSDMMSVACPTASTCVEVGDGGMIRRTTDSGTTWSYVASPFDKALTSVQCPSASTCYAAGDRGTVLKSSDAGATWSFLPSADGNPLYGLSCPSTSTCYAVDNYAHVELTSDGGASWTLQSTPVVTPGIDVPGSGGPNPFAGLFGISCTSVTTCVAVGGFPPSGTDPPILTTTNAGNSWTLETSNAGAGNYLNGVTCVGSTCYAVGRGGAIVTSADGGGTWAAMTSNTTVQLTGIACSSASSCVATGQNGTVDVLSGGTWTATSSLASSSFLASVLCSSGTSCLAVGKQGVTLAFDPTNVAGSATLQAGGGTTVQMNSISCIDASHCAAVGNSGTILTTSDGGQTWLPRASGVTANLSGVSCSGAICVAVGAVAAGSAVILESGDDGNTWAPQTSGVSTALDGVSCPTTSACVAVGTAGVVLTTGDGGITWSPQPSGTTATLAAVACPTASDCYAGGSIVSPASTATIIASTDGGTDWTSQNSNSPQALSAIACTNESACFAGGALGTVVTTVDGGASWSQQGDPISGPTTALNSGPTGITAIFAAACSSVRCDLGTASAGDIMTTPLQTVIVRVSGPYGAAPSVVGGVPANDDGLIYSVPSEAGNVTGTLTCTTTATATSDLGQYPVSDCHGLSDPGYSVVYDLDDSYYQVTGAEQTITFPPITAQTFGGPAVSINPSASSGLAVTLAATGPCQLSATTPPATVTLTGAGTCTVTASQAGDSHFEATDLSRSFVIAKATPTVRLASLVKHPKTGRSTIGVQVLGVTGHVPTGSVTVSSGSAKCTVSKLSVAGTGTCKLLLRAGHRSVAASYAGNGDYAARTATVKVVVAKAKPTLSVTAKKKAVKHGKRALAVTVKVHGVSGVAATGKVKVSGPGAHCTATVKHGVGKCTLKVHKGGVKLTAKYGGDEDYKPVSKKVSVKT